VEVENINNGGWRDGDGDQKGLVGKLCTWVGRADSSETMRPWGMKQEGNYCLH